MLATIIGSYRKPNYLKIIIKINFILLFIISINSSLFAKNFGSVTGYKIPRFVSLKSNESNLRVGPSENYPIKLKYIQENLPLEIIDEYETWRQISDIEGNIGWVHNSLIKGDRYAIVVNPNNKENIYNYPEGRIKGIIKNNNIVKINKCFENWCLIKINQYNGWIVKKNLFGVYANELINKNFFAVFYKAYWYLLEKLIVTQKIFKQFYEKTT